MNIFVSNVSFKMRENHLREVFEKFGEVSSVKIIKDKETGRSKGFGFVEMPNDEQARAAIDSLNGSEQFERNIVVNEARPREERG
jgi:RNA recognition motif-containing protein